MAEEQETKKAEKVEKVVEQPKTEPKKSGKKIAIVLVRGLVGAKQTVKDTCKMLKIEQKNACSVYDYSPSIEGMAKKIKDYVTYGEIDNETHKLLVEKRGEKTKDKEGKEVLKPFFRLSPPRGGFERKGIKKSFLAGGALGDRKEKINDLIKRML